MPKKKEPKKIPKKIPKKKTPKKKNSTGAMPMASESRSVDIKRATNGYVISTWTDKGQKMTIATTKKEAKEVALKMLG